MKIKFLTLFLTLFFLALFFISKGVAQSPKKAFKSLSSHEKYWVYFHPFTAKKAYQVSKDVEKVVDSIAKTKTLGPLKVGNQIDAFKHAFWMWSLAEKIGWRAASSLGEAHEKGNYDFYLQHINEDGELPDKASSDMDAHNNSVGIALYKKYKKQKTSKSEKIEKVIAAVLQGKTKMILQNKSGNYLDKKGNIIPKKDYYGIWSNARILTPTKALHLMIDNPSKSLNLSQTKK
ncbi:hypothetical protein Q4595_00625 [Wenyingzhuangia sp. 1_MG-2023]|nr:hypothetical protein [Wenyingzhuangia sp. 1_MG-2023]